MGIKYLDPDKGIMLYEYTHEGIERNKEITHRHNDGCFSSWTFKPDGSVDTYTKNHFYGLEVDRKYIALHLTFDHIRIPREDTEQC